MRSSLGIGIELSLEVGIGSSLRVAIVSSPRIAIGSGLDINIGLDLRVGITLGFRLGFKIYGTMFGVIVVNSEKIISQLEGKKIATLTRYQVILTKFFLIFR